MIGIVDFGASKSDWVFLDDNYHVLHRISYTGYNPFNVTPSLVLSPEIIKHLSKTNALKIYGAGLINDTICRSLRTLISQQLDKTILIDIHTDVLGAARALFHQDTGIVAMLGTGSMAAFYNGKQITKSCDSLGYILSDEGGGVDIGKSVLRSYYYKTMPEDISRAFLQTYNMSRFDFLSNLKESSNQAQYIASFSYFIQEYQDTAWAHNLLTDCFSSFFKNRLLPIVESSVENVGFVGSVAYLYRDILLSVGNTHNIKISTILDKPIIGLVAYHKQHIKL